MKGKYTYTPQGPPPCGQVVWLCNGEEYGSLEAYKSTSCGAPPAPPKDPPIPPHCVNFEPLAFLCGGYVPGKSRFSPACECR